MERQFRPAFTLALADGARWLIRAGDTGAARVVSALATAMQLQPTGTSEAGERIPGRELLVTVRSERGAPPVNLRGPGPAICALPALTNDAMLTINMARVGLAIAREAQSHGGLLLHAALAEPPSALSEPLPPRAGGERGGGGGIILAGPGTVGKSTASSRLPPPWCSLCDDTTLVVRDSQGRYWAHPWPTWSRFYSYNDDPPPGGSWNVQRAIPLRAIFFLSQSLDDRTEPIHIPQATTMLMEAAQHVSSAMTRRLNLEHVHALHREQLAAAKALARAIPAYILHISLTGAFWEGIERVLQDNAQSPTHRASRRITHHASRFARPTVVKSPQNDALLYVAYTGPSMNPTLREPDLLEVAPYDGRQVRAGDVIYFAPPEGGREIVHRAVRVTPDGIRTRGDNSPTDDPYHLQTANIIGQVVTAQRGSRQRRIAGGRRGILLGYAARARCVANRGISRLLHGAYHTLASSGLFRHLLPQRVRPRLLVFQSKKERTIKLVMGRREVGRCDSLRRRWTIQRPFRLFVDETRLPVIPPPTAESHNPPTTDEHLV
jgi:SynChlorMet cassette protein ScmC